MRHRKNRIAEPAYDIVITGLALGFRAQSLHFANSSSAAVGTQVPSIVYFIWQVCEANLIRSQSFLTF